MRHASLFLILAMVGPLVGCNTGNPSHRELFWHYTMEMDRAGRIPVGATRQSVHESIGPLESLALGEVERDSPVATWIDIVDQYASREVAGIERGLDIVTSSYLSYRFYMDWVFYDRDDRVIWALREYIPD